MSKNLVIISLLFSFLLSACSASTPPPLVIAAKTETTKPQIAIGYGAPGLDGAQVTIMNGLVKQAEAKGWSVTTANANRDSRIQASQIDYFITQKVKAIVVVPEDSQGVCASARQATEAGILFYTIDRAPLGCDINMTVLADNYVAGVQAGEEMVKLLTRRYGQPRGVVLEIQGNLRQNVAQLRSQGFHHVVDPYPQIQVISKPTEWQANQFALATQEVVKTTPIDGLYLHSDCVGIPVVLPVLEQLGQKIGRNQAGHIFIVGVDGCPETLQAIREGYVDQTSSQPFPDFGLIVNWIEKDIAGQPFKIGPVIDDKASWSPANVEKSETGWQLLLRTTSVTLDNVDEKDLWGNQ